MCTCGPHSKECCQVECYCCFSPSGQHNDARMNLAIGLTAARYGATMANYTEVVRLLKTKDPKTDKEKVCGARCRDVITG